MNTSLSNESPSLNQPQPNLKVLLMGRAGAGKTSMRSVVFANYLARDTKRLTATTNVEHSHLRFLGNLVLSLWDCGGQDTFMENYFESQREHIFRDAEVLIYVVEVRTFLGGAVFPLQQLQQSAGLRIREVEKDLKYFKSTADSIKQFSPNARVFCLLHKMDLVEPGKRKSIIDEYTDELRRRSEGLNMKVFGTSIWDETLYEAWSEMINSLVPNVELLDRHLKRFSEVVGADEVVLFEKSTFLAISRATKIKHVDIHRFEKISNLCKQFKLTCGKNQSNFSNFTVHVPSFTAFMERFTSNTYILILISDKEIPAASVLCNVDYAREQFERLGESMKLGPSL